MGNEEDEPKESILDCVTCPVCRDYIQPPSSCCENGHFVCADCKQVYCPVCCTARHPNTNNEVFDKILREVYYPCANQELGCDCFFKHDAIKQHQIMCPHRLVPCSFQPGGCTILVPFGDRSTHEDSCEFGTSCLCFFQIRGFVKQTCAWRGNTSDLERHVFSAHRNTWLFHTLEPDIPMTFLLPLAVNFERVELIKLSGTSHLFWGYVKGVANEVQHISIQYINTNSKPCEFLYAVEFRYGTRRFVFEDTVVSPDISPAHVYNVPNSVTCQYGFLNRHFLAERVVDYHLKISRKDKVLAELRKSIAFSSENRECSKHLRNELEK